MEKDFLKGRQLSSLKDVLPRALKYHFNNFQGLEALAKPSQVRFGLLSPEHRASQVVALQTIKFEVQAYLCQLRRLKFFLHSMQVQKPTELVLIEVWDALMDKEGMISRLANKWATHRSYDDPRGEDDQLHAEVLINLEGSTTTWTGDHLVLMLGSQELNLCIFHLKSLAFISWVFAELKRLNK